MTSSTLLFAFLIVVILVQPALAGQSSRIWNRSFDGFQWSEYATHAAIDSQENEILTGVFGGASLPMK